MADFAALVDRAGELGLEVALDLAFQCAPDHPWVDEHPDWFRHRADGTVRCAENPPKRYEDIYPLDFESADWRRALAGPARRHDVLGRGRDPDLPRRQPSHQALPVLGVADRLGARRAPRRRVPGRGVHPSKGDAPVGQGRVLPVVHLLHVASDGGRADRVLRATPRPRDRVLLPPEPVAQHPRHPHRGAAVRWPARRHGPAGAGRLSGAELRDLRSGVRARGAPGPRRCRGVPRQREVPAAHVEPRRRHQPASAHRPHQPDPTRAPGPLDVADAAVPPHRQPPAALLQQDTDRAGRAGRGRASS